MPVKTRRAALLLVFAFLVARSAFAEGAATAPEGSDSLAPVAFLAGGTWVGEGKWPDGSILRVEQRYFWGPTKRVLHFESYDLASGERHVLYEGALFFDPKRGKIVQWNFKPSGEINEIEVTKADKGGYEVRGSNTWSTIRSSGPDEFHWELRVEKSGEWPKILDATYKRKQ